MRRPGNLAENLASPALTDLNNQSVPSRQFGLPVWNNPLLTPVNTRDNTISGPVIVHDPLAVQTCPSVNRHRHFDFLGVVILVFTNKVVEHRGIDWFPMETIHYQVSHHRDNCQGH